MADAKVLYNVACNSVLEHFKLKKLKEKEQRKVLA